MINWDLVVDKKSFIEQVQDVLPTIEIDSLTNYGASLLNRDRDGFAKKIVFGGVERGRISSQSIKYAVRQAKYDRDTWYTVAFDRLVASALKAKEPTTSDEYIAHAKALTLSLLSSKKDHAFKLTTDHANSVAAAILKHIDPANPIDEKDWEIKNGKKKEGDTKASAILKELTEEAKNRKNSSEVAMFGRMSSSEFLKTVDGAVAMGHAITTHE